MRLASGIYSEYAGAQFLWEVKSTAEEIVGLRERACTKPEWLSGALAVNGGAPIRQPGEQDIPTTEACLILHAFIDSLVAHIAHMLANWIMSGTVFLMLQYVDQTFVEEHVFKRIVWAGDAP